MVSPSLAADARPTATRPFLKWFWKRPLPPEGSLPAGFPTAPKGLEPATCGTCHRPQYQGWRGSRHSLAMDPGVLGQLVEMGPDARDDRQACLHCHAPLAEQADALSAAIKRLERAGGPSTAPSGLYAHGMICAACHVRYGHWYGPPRRDGSSPHGNVLSVLPHHGFTASPAYQDSRFCAACHQFDRDGYSLNGKLLENTYAEWRASRYAAEGRSCQSCHMPDRQHLWRGIHDPAMTRRAVAIHAVAPDSADGRVSGRLTIRNVGAGHDFPTYVTPKVIVEMFQVDAGGHRLGDTLQTYTIGRQVPLDLSREIADTRIAPGRQAVFTYTRARATGAVALVYRVRVEPDAFYTGLFAALLRGSLKPAVRVMIRKALADSRESHFDLYQQRFPFAAG